MKKLYQLWELVKRFKYAILIVFICVDFLILDEYNIFVRMKNRMVINDLRSQIKEYEKGYEQSDEMIENINSGLGTMEKIARERYLMKKDGEDIYLIEDKDE